MSRERLLGRVRDSLRTPTSPLVRGAPHVKPPEEHAAPAGDVSAATPDAESWLPLVGPTFDERLALFAGLSERLTTVFRRVKDVAAAADVVKQIAADEAWDRVASHASPLTDAVTAALGLPVVTTDNGYDADALEACPASVTACEALVAQTASVLVSTRSSGGRALSVLPEHHVVVATADQMIRDVPAAYRLLVERYGNDLPSYAGLITGPSRTGDIERVLVLGAHGPKRLTVLLIDG